MAGVGRGRINRRRRYARGIFLWVSEEGKQHYCCVVPLAKTLEKEIARVDNSHSRRRRFVSQRGNPTFLA